MVTSNEYRSMIKNSSEKFTPCSVHNLLFLKCHGLWLYASWRKKWMTTYICIICWKNKVVKRPKKWKMENEKNCLFHVLIGGTTNLWLQPQIAQCYNTKGATRGCPASFWNQLKPNQNYYATHTATRLLVVLESWNSRTITLKTANISVLPSLGKRGEGPKDVVYTYDLHQQREHLYRPLFQPRWLDPDLQSLSYFISKSCSYFTC